MLAQQTIVFFFLSCQCNYIPVASTLCFDKKKKNSCTKPHFHNVYERKKKHQTLLFFQQKYVNILIIVS